MSPFRQMYMSAGDLMPLDHASPGLQVVGGTTAGRHSMCDPMERHRATGGCFRLEALAERLDMPVRRCAALLDRWILSRSVLLLPQEPEALVPVYQIDLAAGAPFPAVQTILAELSGVFSPVEISEWFISPNLWLADRPPAELIAIDSRAVVGAARADRFIAVG